MKSNKLTSFEKDHTIAAIATPTGHGGVGVIRLSGPHTQSIAVGLIGHLPKPRYAEYVSFLAADGISIDKGLVIYFPSPHSFTGEDILELQGHGGPIILDCLLQRVLQLGACLARPGEFSERAFLNGKIDLIQAEAIADLIAAESEQAARAAVRSLQGEFSNHIKEMVETLIVLRVYLEASLDFSDEPVDFLQDMEIDKKLNLILLKIRKIKEAARQGTLLREGIHVAIVGPPNAGKSSLLNKLTGQDSAIVTSVSGTTRDVIREKIYIDGLPIHIVDTAGLRRTENEIEQEGIKRSLAEIEKADRILYVVDSANVPMDDLEALHQLEFFKRLTIDKRLTVIRNKVDVSEENASLIRKVDFDIISLSVKTGEGLAILHNYLKTSVGYYDIGIQNNFSARRRHLEALNNAELALNDSLQKLIGYKFPELLAEDLAVAQRYLNEITGEFTSEDLLGKIFSSFCIGK
ncbi:MAG: tRNA uridine-5-carboxymethylaminomethyl(34) synthesis GTPase MnmE [Rickettsiella sp.]|nr:tRNA uridine-5-carboxymethylaminomethyl(34) synthesis GTPase MnmE [Rickettsiella sp.]